MGYDNWKKDIDILDNHLKDKSEYKDKSNQEKAKLILDKTLSVYLGEDKADIQIQIGRASCRERVSSPV